MQLVNVGNVFLPDELVREVNAHKEQVYKLIVTILYWIRCFVRTLVRG